MVNLGIAIDIAGSAIFIILLIIGTVKAWPYRKTDKEKFAQIYKPYKWWGFSVWIICNLAASLLFIIV